MKATLHTQNFRVPDFELVSGADIRIGSTFTIAIEEPGDLELFSSNDPVLGIDVQEGGKSIVVNALVEGVSRVRLYGQGGAAMIKEWSFQVYTEEAARLNITGAEVEWR